jgi:hypothetical protein
MTRFSSGFGGSAGPGSVYTQRGQASQGKPSPPFFPPGSSPERWPVSSLPSPGLPSPPIRPEAGGSGPFYPGDPPAPPSSGGYGDPVGPGGMQGSASPGTVAPLPTPPYQLPSGGGYMPAPPQSPHSFHSGGGYMSSPQTTPPPSEAAWFTSGGAGNVPPGFPVHPAPSPLGAPDRTRPQFGRGVVQRSRMPPGALGAIDNPATAGRAARRRARLGAGAISSRNRR